MELPLDTMAEVVVEDVEFVREYRSVHAHGEPIGLRIAREVARKIILAEDIGTSTEDLTEILEQIAEVEPSAFVVVSEVRAQVGETAERQTEALRRGLELKLNQPPLWLKWVQLERDQNRIDRAYQLLRQGLEVTERADDAEPLVAALLAMSAEDPIKDAIFTGAVDRLPAIRAAIDALEKSRAHLTASQQSQLAWLLLTLGRKSEALEIVFEGLRASPNDGRLRNLYDKLRERHPEMFGSVDY